MAPPDPKDAERITFRKLQYCRLADSGQWDLFGQIFLPNTHFQFFEPDGKTIHVENGVVFDFPSRDAFVAHFSESMGKLQTIHIVGPGEMEATGADEVKAIWPLLYQAASKGDTGGFQGTGGGHYYETWRRVDGEWYIAEYKMVRLYWKVIPLGSL